VKGKPKPSEQEIAKDDNFILAGFRHGFSTGSPRGTDHAVLLESVHIGAVNQTSPKVYVFGISFVTASRLRFGAMTTNYYEVEEKWMGEGDLTAKPSEFKPLVCGSQQRGGAAQGSAPFL
jgi:hypothetical protein